VDLLTRVRGYGWERLVRQQDIVDAVNAYLERGELELWARVLDAVRDGQVVVEVTANLITFIPKNHPFRDAFAESLSRLREESGLTHQQVADATEISFSAVIRNMGGQALTQWAVMSLMIRAMGGDPETFREAYERARAEPLTDSPAPRKRRL
jgi:argininosuccinate lyase